MVAYVGKMPTNHPKTRAKPYTHISQLYSLPLFGYPYSYWYQVNSCELMTFGQGWV